MAPPNRPADLPKSTNDTTYFSSMLENKLGRLLYCGYRPLAL